MSTYFQNIKEAFGTLSSGLRLTLKYLTEARQSRKPIGVEDETYFDIDKGIVTLEYPYESLPVPDNARYRLHNEIDDCIVCDKCAKVCPVDCIDIDAIKAPETYGVTSDGTPKRIHAAKFDIDMGKCCFCGLCTTVCPTECLTMTKVYDFSEYDVNDHVYSFADMSLADIAQKRQELAAHEAKKAEAKASSPEGDVGTVKPTVKPKPMRPKPVGAKPAMKPKVGGKPVIKPKTEEPEDSGQGAKKPKPVMKPKIGAKGDASSKPVIKPKMKASEEEEKKEAESDKPKPKFRPRPVIRKKPKDEDGDS
ncbi:MAG: 4Fe-4S binding protein [Marinoscillum sp.]